MPPEANNPQPGVPAQPAAYPQQPQAIPGQATPDNVLIPQAPVQQVYGPQMKPGQPPAPQPLNPGKSNPNSTQNTLLISEIRDGIMIMNDGSYRAVIYTKSVNFDLMSPMEREGIEAAYQGFINSLYFPIQISIRSQKIDMTPYLNRLNSLREQQNNMLLAILMEDYIYFIDDLVSRANIMDKNFYIIVPFEPPMSANKVVGSGKKFFGNIFGSSQPIVTINEQDLNQAKTELANRVQATMNGLTQMGLQAVPLDTQELIELFYGAYNPDTATRQRLAPITDLEVPVVTKGDGDAPSPHLNQAGF
jgi:hypothetical protein